MLTISITVPKIKCVGGDMVILPKQFTKNERISAYTQLTHFVFGTVIDIASIPYQKSGGWVVCRRSFGSLTAHSRLFGIGGFHTSLKTVNSWLAVFARTLFFIKKNFFKWPLVKRRSKKRGSSIWAPLPKIVVLVCLPEANSVSILDI